MGRSSGRPLKMITAKLRPMQAAVGQRETKGQLRPDAVKLPLGCKGHSLAPTASPFQAHT